MSGGAAPVQLAIVGHPNKGKSSIVATLAEDDSVAVSPMPGTTTRARRFRFELDGEPLYELVDTPGFQRATEVLKWLNERSADASDRADLVRAFVSAHAADGPAGRFHDECELLQPVLDGAGILYVVDGTKPFGREYETEMQVLRYTGQPRMALINLIGRGDYIEEWRRALDQYFSLVRIFDAHRADFAARIELLTAFATLDSAWGEPLRGAVTALSAERGRRRTAAARAISTALADMLSRTEQAALTGAREPLEAALKEKLLQRVAAREQSARREIEHEYRHYRLSRSEAEAPSPLDQELFAEESWEVFGLSKQQLLTTGVLSGAAAGGGIDLLLGGASLMLGAGIGAVVGALGAWLGTEELAKAKVLGQPLGGKLLRVGPIRDPNFAWVALGRLAAHYSLVAERNHARREVISADLAAASHVTDAVPAEVRKTLSQSFSAFSQGKTDRDGQAQATEAIAAYLSALDSG